MNTHTHAHRHTGTQAHPHTHTHTGRGTEIHTTNKEPPKNPFQVMRTNCGTFILIRKLGKEELNQKNRDNNGCGASAKPTQAARENSRAAFQHTSPTPSVLLFTCLLSGTMGGKHLEDKEARVR